MHSAKEATMEAVRGLPDSCSMDDVLYRVYFVSQVLEGLEDAEAGRVLTTEELLEQVEAWGK